MESDDRMEDDERMEEDASNSTGSNETGGGQQQNVPRKKRVTIICISYTTVRYTSGQWWLIISLQLGK